MSSGWRVAIGQKQYGPYSLDKLQQIYEEGRVPEEARIWHPDRQKWIPAEHVAELQGEADPMVIVRDPEPEDFPSSHRERSGDTLGDYLAFRRMITPIIIQILFWVGAVLSSMSGIFLMIQSILQEEIAGVFVGFFGMLLGPLIVRIYCELLIVLFRMNETLTDIRNELGKE